MTNPQWAIDEIKAIQSSGIDWFGAPLKVDGVAGPKTLWWMGMLSLCTERQILVTLGLGYHHKRMKEVNGPGIENGGTWVTNLLRPAGLSNQPWCAAYTSHLFISAGIKLPKYFTSAWQYIDWATKNGKLVTDPLPGDMHAILHPKKPGETQIKGHVGIVIAREGDTVYCNDGNVGDAVRCGRRKMVSEMKFIRIIENTEHRNLTFPEKTMRIDGLTDR